MSNLLDAANGISGQTMTYSVEEFVQYIYDKGQDPLVSIGDRGLSVRITVVGQADAICGTIMSGRLDDEYIAVNTSRHIVLVKQTNIASIQITSDCVRFGENAKAFR